MSWAVAVSAVALLALVEANVFVYSRDRILIVDEFQDMPASFGSYTPIEGLQGLLVHGSPADGCGPLEKPPAVDNFTDKWIVLLARYNCSFEVKIRNAQAAGYDCAIVHNVNSSDLETMSAKNSEGIVIPSVFVNDLAGQLLLQYLYDNDSSYYIMVNRDLPFNINTHLLLPFAIVVALCLLVMVIFLLVKCVKDRRRANRHRLPSRSLRRIPTCRFSKGDPYDTCAICLDDYVDGDRLRVLPCAHAYHSKCIDPWLTRSRRVCPVCKRRVLTAGETLHSDSDTEPLLSGRERANQTEGGTFDEQSVNPFVLAVRQIMNRRRAVEAERARQEQTGHQPDNEETVEVVQERAPLLGRRSSRDRQRRTRRTRSVGGRVISDEVTRPIVQPAQPSINGSRGEIGVAAIPAPREPDIA